MTQSLRDADWWEWAGDPNATSGWTVIGEDESGKRALVDYNSLEGASSQPLSDGIPGEWLMPEEKAKELHDRIQTMDQTYWPGFNPTVARIQGGKVVEYIHPPGQSDG
jgi:hypothetical protein